MSRLKQLNSRVEDAYALKPSWQTCLAALGISAKSLFGNSFGYVLIVIWLICAISLRHAAP